MASWVKPRFPLPEVDAAGNALIDKDVPLATLDHALEVINNWRSAHAYPLNSLQIVLSRRGREVQASALVSRRIKRLPAIHDKLRRMRRHGLTLSEMQDIGGCRAVVGSVKNVESLVAAYKQKRRGALHILDDEDDYIQYPKKSGYRSAHLIYRYQARGARGKPYNGRKIEIQIRSDLQHWWATAVETASTFQRQSLKSSTGDPRWLRFFALVSSAFALREGTPTVPKTPADRGELIQELRSVAADLAVEAKLEAYSESLKRSEQLRRHSRHFVVVLTPGLESIVNVMGFRAGEQQLAMKELFREEKKISDIPGAEAVMVSARSIDDVVRGYPAYFIDTKQFLDALRREVAD